MSKGGPVQEGDGEDRGGKHKTYRMAFPEKAGPRTCPVEGFFGRVATRTSMQVQFWHRHVHDTMIILEEDNLPHSWCPLCNMLVP